jgi:hypothetical protein
MPDQRCRERTYFLSQAEAIEKIALHLESAVEGAPSRRRGLYP